jgi:hypothetical protein
MAILTFLYLFGTNVRSAYRRWANSPSYSEKSRHSPNVQPSDILTNASTTARRISERPVPLTLPSRKSSQHLSGLTTLTPTSSASRAARLGTAYGAPDHLTSRYSYSASAPASPTNSPRPSYAEEPPAYTYRDNDMESAIETPSISRRSSFIYMNGNDPNQPYGYPESAHPTSAILHNEPSSYFLPIPGSNAPAGLGFTTTNGASHIPGIGEVSNLRRASSSNLSNHYHSSQSSRKTTMPRLLSTADWHSAAKAKEKSVLGLMVDSLPVPGASGVRGRGWKGWWNGMRGFVRWFWKARNGVVGKSWKEVLAVAWPAGVVWLVINGLFFVG